MTRTTAFVFNTNNNSKNNINHNNNNNNNNIENLHTVSEDGESVLHYSHWEGATESTAFHRRLAEALLSVLIKDCPTPHSTCAQERESLHGCKDTGTVSGRGKGKKRRCTKVIGR